MEENGIEVRDYKSVSSDVALLASNQLKSSFEGTEITGNGTNKAEDKNNDLIWADPGSCCHALYSKLNPEKVILQQSPLALAKALKVGCCPSPLLEIVLFRFVVSDVFSYSINYFLYQLISLQL